MYPVHQSDHDYGGVQVAPGDDPNFDPDAFYCCYSDFGNGGDIVFPFHWPCYTLLAKVLTGASDPRQIDKDLLYHSLGELCEAYASCLNISYGDPEPPAAEQFWICTEGQELLVSNPTPTPYLKNVTEATLASHDFKLPSLFHDITAKVTSDPFEKLPYDIIYKICFLLPSASIIDLSMASKQVFTLLNTNTDFWRSCIRSKMPWFFELHHLLDDLEIMKGKDMMGLFQWATRATTARMYMTGPFMSIANRRRIWEVCERIADPYFERMQRKANHAPAYIDRMISETATCGFMPIVSCPLPQKMDLALIFWVQSWDEIYEKENELETFWDDAEGSLVGISLAPRGHRRLFGRDDSMDAVSKIAINFEKKEWIKGFILHIPEIDLCDASRPDHAGGPQDPIKTSTSPKGITVGCLQSPFRCISSCREAC